MENIIGIYKNVSNKFMQMCDILYVWRCKKIIALIRTPLAMFGDLNAWQHCYVHIYIAVLKNYLAVSIYNFVLD